MYAAGCLLAGLAISLSAMGADAPATATKPAASAPACCGDMCQKMSHVCCTADDKGKVTCAMGGGCCVKPDTKAAETKAK
jgi:hypothetical protein